MAYVNMMRKRGGGAAGGGGGGRSYNSQNYRPQYPSPLSHTPQPPASAWTAQQPQPQPQPPPQPMTMMSYGNVGQPGGDEVSYVDHNTVGVGGSGSNNNAQFVRLALLYPYRNDQPDQFMENPDPAWNTAEAAQQQQQQQQQQPFPQEQQQQQQIDSAGAPGKPCEAPVLRKTLYNPTSVTFFGRLGESHCILVYSEATARVANKEKQTTHPTVHVCVYENSTVQWVERTLANPNTGQPMVRKSPIAPTLMPDTPVFARLYPSKNPAKSSSFASGNLSCMPGTRVAILPSKNIPFQFQLTLIQEA